MNRQFKPIHSELLTSRLMIRVELCSKYCLIPREWLGEGKDKVGKGGLLDSYPALLSKSKYGLNSRFKGTF